MTTFPRSPRTLKGAIVAVDPFNPLASVIVFQYNPESLTRNLNPQIGSEGGSPTEALRIKGAPIETFTAELVIDATDQLEKKEPTALEMGIYPQISALEMTVFPKTAVVIANTVLAALGTIEVIAPEAPLTLFAWGYKRVVPVNVTSVDVTEQAYDTNLNPIRAEVKVGLRVLTYDDLPVLSAGRAIFIANQVMREVMATLASTENLSAIIGGDVRLL